MKGITKMILWLIAEGIWMLASFYLLGISEELIKNDNWKFGFLLIWMIVSGIYLLCLLFKFDEDYGWKILKGGKKKK